MLNWSFRSRFALSPLPSLYTLFCPPHRLHKGTDFVRILLPRTRLDARRNVDAPRLENLDRLRNVVGVQSARDYQLEATLPHPFGDRHSLPPVERIARASRLLQGSGIEKKGIEDAVRHCGTFSHASEVRCQTLNALIFLK